MEKLRVVKVSYKDKDKNGQPLKGKYGPYFIVGIQTDKYGDVWLNGFSKTNGKDMEGKEVELEVYDEEFNGKTYKKFKFPSKAGANDDRVKKLEDRVSKIEFHLANEARKEPAKVPGTDVDYPEPAPEEIPW